MTSGLRSGRQARVGPTYGLALLGGAVLFFINFAAIFNGSWTFLVFFLLSYMAAGALAVGVGGAAPVPLALVLAAPAIPWVAWLFPASIAEAGVVRALWWPALLLLIAGLGWTGGKMGGAVAARRPRRSRAA